jgi:hypothetical protein
MTAASDECDVVIAAVVLVLVVVMAVDGSLPFAFFLLTAFAYSLGSLGLVRAVESPR